MASIFSRCGKRCAQYPIDFPISLHVLFTSVCPNDLNFFLSSLSLFLTHIFLPYSFLDASKFSRASPNDQANSSMSDLRLPDQVQPRLSHPDQEELQVSKKDLGGFHKGRARFLTEILFAEKSVSW